MGAIFGPAGNSLEFYDEGHKSTLEAPGWVERYGLDCYEYQAGKGIYGSDETFRKIGEKAKEHNVRLSFHAPYYISLSSVEEEKRLNSVSYIEKSVDAASKMGADLIVIHTGSASKISREEAVALAKDTVYKALLKCGDRGVTLALETMGKKNQLGTLEEVLDICSIDKRLRPVIDFGHLNARNVGGLFVTKEDYLRVFDLISEKLGPEYAKTLHCHFSKIEYTSAGEKKHLTLDDEVFGPPYEPLMECIAGNGLSPRIICESDGTQARDALRMKNYYQSIIKGEKS